MTTARDRLTTEWLSVKEVADYLGLKESTIYQYVNERRIPFYKVPGSSAVRFKRSEIDEWMASGRVETKDEYLARITKKGGSDGTSAPEEARRQVVH